MRETLLGSRVVGRTINSWNYKIQWSGKNLGTTVVDKLINSWIGVVGTSYLKLEWWGKTLGNRRVGTEYLELEWWGQNYLRLEWWGQDAGI